MRRLLLLVFIVAGCATTAHPEGTYEEVLSRCKALPNQKEISSCEEFVTFWYPLIGEGRLGGARPEGLAE